MINCIIIYKITKSKKWTILYGLNPLILYQGITNGHNEILMIMFILLAMYCLVRKKNVKLAVISLAISAGIKYFTILLLPFICFYELRDEKVLDKIKKSVPLILIFFIVCLMPYMFYMQDLSIFTAMLVQGDRYGGSILKTIKTVTGNEELTKYIKYNLYILFIAYYLNICIVKNLFTKNQKLRQLLNDYQNALIFFIFGVLSNFQIWYLIWLFPSIMWQRKEKRTFAISIFSSGWMIIYIYFYYQSDDSILNVYQSLAIIVLATIILLIDKNTRKNYKLKGEQIGKH